MTISYRYSTKSVMVKAKHSMRLAKAAHLVLLASALRPTM